MTQGFESFLSTTQYIYTTFSVINQEIFVKFSIKSVKKYIFYVSFKIYSFSNSMF